MKLAAQLYTIRKYTKTPEDIKASLKKIKEIGYNSVQVSAFGPIEPSLLKEYLLELEMEVCVTHTPLDRILHDTDSVIAEHKLWNCNYIGLGHMGHYLSGGKEGYDEFLKDIMPVAEKIYDSGLKFLYHNHKDEFAKIDGNLNGMAYLAEKTDPKKFGFLADFYWVQAGGASPVKFIEEYLERLDVVHFKDMTIADNQITMCEIFNGNMDYEAIYNACLKHGIKHVAVEQDVCPADPFDSLKISFDNLKKRNMFI